MSGVLSKNPGDVLYCSSGVSQCLHCQATPNRPTLAWSMSVNAENLAPAGATRVDLAGKTVMPALVDIHNHLGWTNLKTNQATKTSFTRELVIDHLRRYAYYGVAATLSMGLDRWDVNPDLPYQLRNET